MSLGLKSEVSQRLKNEPTFMLTYDKKYGSVV
jgi:hypothetical protein